VANVYEIIQGMVRIHLLALQTAFLTFPQDGNPASPQEFDVSPHDEGEVYFKADDDASKVCSWCLLTQINPLAFPSESRSRVTLKQTELTTPQAAKNRVLILNYIHQGLHHATERKVPILKGKQNDNIEIYHRVKYQGVELDVCIYWPPRGEGEFKEAAAMVKFADDDLSAEYADKEGNGVVSTVSSNFQATPFPRCRSLSLLPSPNTPTAHAALRSPKHVKQVC